ncbi:oplophorus-luciferin 2-monooxygenase non-catalytic subunit-like [Penaeus indicus]|uniref:oplophorus-luciferin 2-monooxygenase non-catalytic subunit-like n=1 Tax=Penaeus indicus TaxID=29960 RepID=UPI00300D41B2
MDTKTLLYILVTISACGGLTIPERSTQKEAKHSGILPPLPSPIWNSYAQNKVEFFQRRLKSDSKDRPSLGVSSSRGISVHPQSKLLTDTPKEKGSLAARPHDVFSNWVSRKVPDKVSHVRKVTGKSDNLSETAPESLRNLLNKLNQKLPLNPEQDSQDCSNVCPPSEDFWPCQCDPCSKVINCSAVTNLNQLQELFHTVSFPIKNYTTFMMIQYEFPSVKNQTLLTDNLFGGVSFINIVIENTLVESIAANAFAGSEGTLEEISLQYNIHLRHFPFEEMVHFTNLKTLRIAGSSLSSIPVLSRVPQLQNLYLNENKITNISPMAFADLPALEVLDIGLNQLETINAHTFYLSAKTVLVFLDHNYINSIEEEAFSKEQPTILDISHNSLPVLEETIFTPILDTVMSSDFDGYINAEENPLHCNDILWLQQYPTYYLYLFLSGPGC